MQDLVNVKHLEALYLLMLRTGGQKSVCAPLHCLAANLNSTQLVYLFESCRVTMLKLKRRILGSQSNLVVLELQEFSIVWIDSLLGSY